MVNSLNYPTYFLINQVSDSVLFISHGPNVLKREYGTVDMGKWGEGWDLLARSGILRCVFGGFGRFVGGNPRRGKWLGGQS
jgi:hypothetical protein